MCVQLEHVPQKLASSCPLDEDSRGWRWHSTAMVSIRARVYFPAPAGPARMSEWGSLPALMPARRPSTAVWLPRNSWKLAGSAGAESMGWLSLIEHILRLCRELLESNWLSIFGCNSLKRFTDFRKCL